MMNKFPQDPFMHICCSLTPSKSLDCCKLVFFSRTLKWPNIAPRKASAPLTRVQHLCAPRGWLALQKQSSGSPPGPEEKNSPRNYQAHGVEIRRKFLAMWKSHKQTKAYHNDYECSFNFMWVLNLNLCSPMNPWIPHVPSTQYTLRKEQQTNKGRTQQS